ncbi:DUF6715 family protein [Catonella massiliensis]|jgi:hypothetical protein|uniref:Uncharacterized protein n=1 Tax=Catonella massiliensis TaxID=2799636 RepID=A0ABS1IZY7_9FIRM|nr:DUF6715 family protein [Catonella massiliensis]MBK5897441.1 hypothetical protein [Catonella massiliensis]
MYKKTQNPVVVGIVMALLAIFIIGGFFLVRSIGLKNLELKKSKTEVEKLMELNLDDNYPGNAREVLKIYNRILKCCYNEELTDEQIKKLAEQNQKLFDEQLLEKNPLDQYVEKLKKDIEDYKSKKTTIANIAIQDLAEAEREERGGYKFCNLLVSYIVKDTKGLKTTNEKYYLREDDKGRWKILFWELTYKTF